ncbi:MAG TPA: MFS transporter [Alphaproteobacteria bacterium]|mgnify:FL=1|nr:MFS transporter [Alphaproteobacteria bacterium]HIK86960.1 MFS transporter [Alphaproteobacteria bacterium]|tara:strand:+ start:3336 stop:4544 length:1209 start_codon:yes stop_codon:yes gene_type:complete
MQPQSKNSKNQNWYIIFGVWLIYFCFGFTVSSIAPIVPYITNDLDISYKQMGLILGAWQFTYIFFALPAGFIIDKYGLKVSIFIAAMIITLSLISRGFSNNFYHMWLAVALFGIGGPLISVGAPKASSLWSSQKNRAISMGILVTGPLFGGITSLSFMNSIFMSLLDNNWKTVYFFYSLVPFISGCIWLIICNKYKIFYKKNIFDLDIKKSISEFNLIITKKRFLIILILGTSSMFLIHGISGWLPKIISSKGININFSSFLASIPIFIGIISALIIPRFSNNKTRIIILLMLFLNAILALFLLQSLTLHIFIFGLILLGISTGSLLSLLLNHLSETKDISYNNMGIAGGLFFAIIEIGGVLGPFSIGIIYDYYTDFNIALSFYALLITLMIVPLYILKKLK